MSLATVRGVEIPEYRDDIALGLASFETVYASQSGAMEALDLFIGQSVLAGNILTSQQRYLFGRSHNTLRGVEAVWVSDQPPVTDEKPVLTKQPLLEWLAELSKFSEEAIDDQRQQQIAENLTYLLDLHLFGVFSSRERFIIARQRFARDKARLQPV